MNVLNVCKLRRICGYVFLVFTLMCLSNLAVGSDKESVVRNNSKVTVSKSGEDVSFVRTYTYRANDDDSKNTSKKKAIEQIKIELNEEVGTYIEHYLEINYEDHSGVTKKDVKQEINSISAGITRLKILDEKWDGKTYFIKAKVDIDPKQTMIALTEAMKSKSAEKDIKRLNLILDEQKRQINASNKRVENAHKDLVSQEIINKTRKTELDNTNIQLAQARMLLKKYNIEIEKSKTELEKIQLKVDSAKRRMISSEKKACMMVKGMLQNEVYDAIGKPDISRSSGGEVHTMYYGKVQITILYGMVHLVRGCNTPTLNDLFGKP